MECLDGQSFGAVNDGHCDCRDGSDEPGTTACSKQLNAEGRLFACHDGGQLVNYTTVGDGKCDCCDGSDETGNLKIPCPHACVKQNADGAFIHLDKKVA